MINWNKLGHQSWKIFTTSILLYTLYAGGVAAAEAYTYADNYAGRKKSKVPFPIHLLTQCDIIINNMNWHAYAHAMHSILITLVILQIDDKRIAEEIKQESEPIDTKIARILGLPEDDSSTETLTILSEDTKIE